MYNFTLSNPTKVFFGAEQRKELAGIISSYGNKVLLVYGSGSIKKNGIYDNINKSLTNTDISVIEFGGVPANPTNKLVNKGALICRDTKTEVILAVGGGSVIDCAKAIAIAVYYEDDSWDLITRKSTVKKALPIIAVPTISGTGSEMNSSCVISNQEKLEKRGFSNPMLQPKAAFLDPTFCYSVKPLQTAYGAADILAHVLDTSYLVNGRRMDMLCQVMEAVCRTVIYHSKIAVHDLENYEARANLMWASSWGLNGYLKNGNRQLAACHAIEHEISARYDIAHGLGIAILLPRWMRYIMDEEAIPLYAQFGKAVFPQNVALNDEACATIMLEQLENYLYNDLGIPSTFSEIGVGDMDFSSIAAKVCWNGILPGYRELKPHDVENILAMCQQKPFSQL